MTTRPNVLLLFDPGRDEAADVVEEIRAILRPHAGIIELEADDAPLAPDLGAEVAVVVGGDGTLMRQARRVLPLDIPILGVNVGRLGFLAEFDADMLRTHLPTVLSPNRRRLQLIMLLEAKVITREGNERAGELAVNDCVVASGPPYSMIDLQLDINGAQGPTLSGDGVIVATPTGSTAYNVSAGGPIVHPSVDAAVITPLAAHSLAFRPIVVSAFETLSVTVLTANEGTALIQDGQITAPLDVGDRVEIRRHNRKVAFIANPDTTYWRILQDKLRWAERPGYRRG